MKTRYIQPQTTATCMHLAQPLLSASPAAVTPSSIGTYTPGSKDGIVID